MDNIDESVELNSNYRSGEMKKSSFSHSYQREGFVIPTIRDIEESSYQPEISCKSKSLFDSVKIEHSRARWVNQGLKILFYITKFVRQMKNHSNQASFKYLNSEMVELIGDISSDSNELLKKLSKSQIFLQMVMQKINNLPTIEPDSMFKLFWDIFILTQIMINIFFIPMKLGFNFSIESTTLQVILETLPTWTFVIDIVLNFFTAFYDKGQIHRQKAQIFERYVKFYFWWDLFIVLPFLLALFEVEYIQYIQILRLSRVKYIVQNIIGIINPSETIQAITSLIQSVFFIMFVSHFCACLWSLIGEMQNSQGLPSWLSAREIENADWSTKYIHSLYFSTITTLTVGYGDIIPTTNIERIYVIMMALVICGVFGYTISSIGEILKQLTEKESKFKQKMLSLTNYLKFKKINKQLQLQVRKYFEYVFTMEQDSNEFGDSLMNQLTKDLKEKVAIDIYEGMLIQSRLINKTLSKKSVQKLCSFVQEQKCAPEVTIASQNTQAQKLYFLQKGEIQLICDTNLRETKLALITANKFIGEREFIIQSDYKYSIKTANFCQLAYINYADFIKVVREDAQEDEKFCMMRDSLQFNQDKRNYGQVCYVCQWTHQFTDCPIIFLKINKEKVRNLCLVPFSQSRKPTERREKFRSPGMRFLREDAIQCLIDNSLINSEDLNPAFLEQLGYKMEVQSLLSVEKLKSISSSEKISSQSSSVVPFCKQISITRRFSKPKIRTSLYAEPDARNLRSQNSFMSKVGNKISSRLSIPSYTQFPSTSPDKFNKGTHEFEMAKQTSTAFEQTNMISQLQEEMNQITNPTKINSRCDYDIDRQFIAKNYYPNQNFDDIIAKFKKRQYTIIKMPLFSLHQSRKRL